uniref:DNA 3'-5' helicase n=1 Tax=Candidatus Methanogaster sp. ANME-2c ERB4 TaxID=2759911 RepID=A0A7G9YDT7_9EURY|nr:ATP-dependent RNA helicase DbpA [Methanosarcinales archaeon ANME-2c ERB4]
MQQRKTLNHADIYTVEHSSTEFEKNGIDMAPAYRVLQKYFGYTTFLNLQEDVIRDILLKKDVFVLMPTGGGKSLCYQLPALLLDGVTIVVSPLIALMKDQVDALKTNGIAAANINSSLNFAEMQNVKLDLAENMISILYVAPERLMIPDFLSALKRLNVSLIAIDEAHCISEWGHDFRPGYRQLKVLKEHFPKVPLVALTATATSRVQEDITTQLRLSDPKTYKASFNRKNLFYQVKPKDNAYDQLLQYLKGRKNDSGIIYCYSRKSADDLANKLKKEGYRALPYHAGLKADLRTETQDKFIKDDVEIIVATVAFGMGIDKSNVRFVIHYDLPKNLETYYQETGRAGRDGEESDCIIFFSRSDMGKISYFIEQKEDETEKQNAYKKLRCMADFCESGTCRRKILLEYFGETYNETNCGNCDNCLNPKETTDGTVVAQKIVSCVAQTGERFGVNYIADILYGSRIQKIVRNRHDTIAAHGTGKEYSKKQWQAFTRELVQQGCLKSEGDRYPIIKLTQDGCDILSGTKEVLLTKPEEEVKIIQKDVDEGFNHDLFEILRSLRKKLADDSGMPPYIIFHDSSLIEMSTYFPRSRSDFRMIIGVGESKLEKYGELFLNEIINYCEECEHVPHPPLKKETHSDKSGEHLVTVIQKPHSRAYAPWTEEEDEMLIADYKAGKTIEELMALFGRQKSDIKSRLLKLGMLPDILCGSSVQKIDHNQHDTVAAYSAEKECSKGQCQAFTKEPAQPDYPKSEDDRYPIIKLTQDGGAILSGTKEVLLTKPEEKIGIIQKDVDGSFDNNLFEILRSLRKKLAADAGMPPYIIFHDSSLIAMATHFPRSRSDFQKIAGVGEIKLEKYGELFLEEIIGYCNCKEHGIKPEHISTYSHPKTKKESIRLGILTQ